jgi:hypothetical protein
VGFTVPAGLADAKAPGTGTEPAAAAATPASTATPATATLATSAGAATLTAAWTSLLGKNGHMESS